MLTLSGTNVGSAVQSVPCMIGPCTMYVIPLIIRILRVIAIALLWIAPSILGNAWSPAVAFTSNSYPTESNEVPWSTAVMTDTSKRWTSVSSPIISSYSRPEFGATSKADVLNYSTAAAITVSTRETSAWRRIIYHWSFLSILVFLSWSFGVNRADQLINSPVGHAWDNCQRFEWYLKWAD